MITLSALDSQNLASYDWKAILTQKKKIKTLAAVCSACLKCRVGGRWWETDWEMAFLGQATSSADPHLVMLLILTAGPVAAAEGEALWTVLTCLAFPGLESSQELLWVNRDSLRSGPVLGWVRWDSLEGGVWTSLVSSSVHMEMWYTHTVEFMQNPAVGQGDDNERL